MKIGLISDYLNPKPSGIQNYNLSLLRHLTKKDQSNKYETIKLPGFFKYFGSYSWVFYPLLPLITNLSKYDLIFNCSGIPIFLGKRKKNIFLIFDLSPLVLPKAFTYFFYLYFRYFVSLSARNSFLIITISENSKIDIVRFLKIPESKIQIIYPAISKDFKIISNDQTLKNVREKYQLPERFFICVGTVSPRKNINRVVEALFRSKKLNETNLVIVGEKGWKYKESINNAVNFDHQRRIIFTGFVEQKDLPVLYNLAVAFIYPSLYEGFGLPILEAMACGCPVITSNCSSMPEVAGKAALLVNPYSVDEITKAMENIENNINLRRKLILLGNERVKMFSWENSAKKLARILKK